MSNPEKFELNNNSEMPSLIPGYCGAFDDFADGLKSSDEEIKKTAIQRFKELYIDVAEMKLMKTQTMSELYALVGRLIDLPMTEDEDAMKKKLLDFVTATDYEANYYEFDNQPLLMLSHFAIKLKVKLESF